MTKYLAAALLTTALFTCTASAQTTSNKTAATDSAASHREGEWRASKLVGVNVYNEANEKIGDINDVILDKAGKVENVILGVGGFLGMGEHYVAVAYDKLKWSNEPPRSTTASTTIVHLEPSGDKRRQQRAHSGRRYRAHDGSSDDAGRSEGQWLLVSRSRHLQRDQGPVESNAAVQILKPKPAASVNLSGRQTS